MSYQCPLCHQSIDHDVKAYIDHTEQHIVDMIKADHPDWESGDGSCEKCLEYYRKQMRGEHKF